MVNMSGSPISGFLYGIYPWLPFLLSALAYAIAGVAATRLPKHEAPHDEAGNSFIRAFTEGWSWTFRKPLLVISVAAISVLNFGINGIQYAIQLHLALSRHKRHLHRIHQHRRVSFHVRRRIGVQPAQHTGTGRSHHL